MGVGGVCREPFGGGGGVEGLIGGNQGHRGETICLTTVARLWRVRLRTQAVPVSMT